MYMKRLLSLSLIIILIFSFCACSDGGAGKNKTPDKANVFALNDPTGWGLIKVKTDRSYAFNVDYLNTADEITAKLKSGEADIATLPLDAAARVYNETNGAVKALAVSSAGYFHILSKNKEIKTLADLAGMKLYISETESFERLILDYLLGKTGYEEGKYPEINALGSNDEVVSKAEKEGTDVYILPVYYAAKVISKDTGVLQVTSLKREWEKLNGTPLAAGIIVVRADYADKNPELIKDFRNFAEVSLNYISDNSTAGKELLDAGLLSDSTIAKRIIPGCYFGYMDGKEMKESAALCLSELYTDDASAIGGKLPDDGFYIPAG